MFHLLSLPDAHLFQTKQPVILAVVSILLALTTLAVLVRVISRAVILRTFTADDYFLVVSYFLCTALNADIFAQAHYGLGMHTGAEAYTNMHKLQLASNVSQLLFVAGPTMAKISMCMTYLRIFDVNRVTKYIVRAVMLWLVVGKTTLFFVTAFQCDPVIQFQGASKLFGTQTHCVDFASAYYIAAIGDPVSDFLFISLSVPQVVTYSMHPRQRNWVLAVLSFGMLAVAAGIVRVIRIMQFRHNWNVDPTWKAFDISIWSGVAFNVVVLCAALLCIKPLIVKICPAMLGSAPSVNNNKSRAGTTAVAAFPSGQLRSGDRSGSVGSGPGRFGWQGVHITPLDVEDEEKLGAGEEDSESEDEKPPTSEQQQRRDSWRVYGCDEEDEFQEIKLDEDKKVAGVGKKKNAKAVQGRKQ